jgi:uncharacterized oxidoreductase
LKESVNAMKLSGNTVLITGGATGIGFAMAKAFNAGGSEVIICGRRKDRLQEAQRRLPALHIRPCDVSVEADRASLAKWANSQFPHLNILVNNAGIQRDIDFKKGIADYRDGESEIGINLEAPIALSGRFIPIITGKDNASIINVSSGLGFIPSSRMPVYSATKAGLHAFSMALRHQLAKIGITVVEVIPPAIDTELNPAGRAQRGDYRAGVTPEEFVDAVMAALEKDMVEIGFGMTAGLLTASRADLDQRFQQMNSRW